MALQDKTCMECGDVLSGRRRKFCTDTCKTRFYCTQYSKAGKFKRPPQVKHCAMCGEEFTAQGYGAGARKFCSAQCAEMHTLSIRAEAALSRAKKLKTAKCVLCGNVFEVSYHDSRALYCSKKCKRDSSKNKNTCVVCGDIFRAPEKKKTCSDKCRVLLRAYTNRKQREAGESKRVLRSVRKSASAIVSLRKFRHMACTRLLLFRKHKSCAEVARVIGEPETTTHKFLRDSPAYKRLQEKRSAVSPWRSQSIRSGTISKLYRRESNFVTAVVESLIDFGIRSTEEVSAGGVTKRKIDIIAEYDGKRYGVECKNGNKTTQEDQCLGQALVKCSMLAALPVCCFPSDALPDQDFVREAEALGVIVCDETTIVERLSEV